MERLAAKPEDLNSTPKSYMLKKENQLPLHIHYTQPKNHSDKKMLKEKLSPDKIQFLSTCNYALSVY